MDGHVSVDLHGKDMHGNLTVWKYVSGPAFSPGEALEFYNPGLKT